MKLEQIPYFVKFIFSCENGECFSTSDSEMLKFIIDAKTKESISALSIGQKVMFEPTKDNNKTYEITDIKIRHIFDDTEMHKYGVDMEDCIYPQGESKEWLFSILISTKTI